MCIQVFTPDGSIVDGEIVDHKNGTYEFLYIVPKEGNFSLALRLYDQHIKGSPFKLTVTRALEAEAEVGGLCLSFCSCKKKVNIYFQLVQDEFSPNYCEPQLRYTFNQV